MRQLIALALACLVPAAPAAAQDADIGRALYAQHCAQCHGIEGRGDGALAGAMIMKPTNLTELAAQNGGTFPMERVVFRIDGRDPLVSHGSPMPVFGPFFEGILNVPLKTAAGQPILTSQPVVDLVTYLLEIQRQE